MNAPECRSGAVLEPIGPDIAFASTVAFIAFNLEKSQIRADG